MSSIQERTIGRITARTKFAIDFCKDIVTSVRVTSARHAAHLHSNKYSQCTPTYSVPHAFQSGSLFQMLLPGGHQRSLRSRGRSSSRAE